MYTEICHDASPSFHQPNVQVPIVEELSKKLIGIKFEKINDFLV
jgi:hypothetical protein